LLTTIDQTKHVDSLFEGFRTRVQFSPSPPNSYIFTTQNTSKCLTVKHFIVSFKW